MTEWSVEIRSCPICQSGRGDKKGQEGRFDLYQCLDCGMLYTRNPMTVESKKTYYEVMADRRRDSLENLKTAHYTLAGQIKSVPLYSHALYAINRLFPTGEVNIADVGCAGGLFLLGAQVVEDGFNLDRPPRFRVCGVAFDQREKADTEMYAGCPVYLFDEARLQLAGWADVVTMFNVLEHVNDPQGCLALVRVILKNGGVLLVDVPNNQVMRWKSKISGRWPSLDLGEHINHFTRETWIGL